MVVALLVLGLAMAAATVAISVVDAVVLRQLPFEDSEDLTALVESAGSSPSWQSISGREVMEWQGRLEAFDSWGAVAEGTEVLQISGERVRVVSARVTPSLFTVLRTKPVLGRVFTTADEVDGHGSVAVISFGLWQSMFGGDSRAIGTVLHLAAGPATVIGVLPRNGGYPIATRAATETQIWTPLDVPTEGNYLRLIARLRPEISVTVASAQLRAAAQALIQADPIKYEHWSPTFVPLYDVVVGPVRSWMLLVFSAVVVLLLVACVNMANVLLVRSSGRSSEIATRAALGASRQRLALMLFGESVLLSLVPILLALIVAPWGIEAAKATLPGGIARIHLAALDARILVIALASALVTTLIVGLVPALHASRSDLMSLLRAREDGPLSGRKWRSALLIGEIALVSVLTVASTLFVGSFVFVTHADLGFDRSGLIQVTPPSELTIPAGDAMRRLQMAPGVTSVALVDATWPLLDRMLGSSPDTGGVKLARLDVPDGIMVDRRRVSGGFFATAGISVVNGTPFGDDDGSRTSLVVDDAAARQLFGAGDPIGRQVRLTGSDVPLTIVGISRQVKRDGPERAARRPTVFQPIDADASRLGVRFLVRLSRPLNALRPTLEGTIATFTNANSRWPADLDPLETTFQRLTAPRRFTASLLALLGSLALLIGTAGVYAVMASLLSQQIHEFGVRAALGETPGQLGRRILYRAIKHVLAGLAIALPLAWWVSRGFGALFFGVHPTDLSVYLFVAAIVTLAGLLASVPVAQRAARLDPIRTLRAI